MQGLHCKYSCFNNPGGAPAAAKLGGIVDLGTTRVTKERDVGLLCHSSNIQEPLTGGDGEVTG